MNELPCDMDAERAVLGSILLNREAIIPIAGWLAADDFYLAKHAAIYTAALRCFHQRIPPDTRTIADALRAAGSLESIGGVLYLTDLVCEVPTSYHVEYYGRIVQRHAVKRRVIQAGGRIAALGYQADLDADQTLAQAQLLLGDAAPAGARGGFARVADVLTEIEDRGPADGLLTGLSDLDHLTGGLMPGNLCLLAGIPGSGKTSLAVQIAWEYSKAIGPAGFVSLEMTREELVERIIAYETGIATQQQRSGDYSDTDRMLVYATKTQMAGMPLYIEDDNLTPDAIRSRALRLAHEVNGIGILVIDYLGQVAPPPSRSQSSAQQYNEMAKQIKALARELACPIILCSQLNRDVFRRPDKRPALSDIREAGEAPADQVVVVMRPDMFDPTDRPGEADLYVVKNRHGPTGRVTVVYDGPRFRFRPLARYRGVDGYGA